MEQTNESDTPDSGIFSPDNISCCSTVAPSNISTPNATLGEAQPANGHLLTPMDSGISSPFAKSDAYSHPVDAEKLESALNLQLTVTGPNGSVRALTIPKEATVDELIAESAQKCGLGSSANVYLMNGTETLQRGSKLKVKQTKLANGNNLQLFSRCVGG